MHDPYMEVTYRVTPCTPKDVRDGLAEKLGARVGDSIRLYGDGMVTVAREIGATDAREAVPLLRRLSPSGVDHPVLRQVSRAHLELV